MILGVCDGSMTQTIFISDFRQIKDVYRTGSRICPFNPGVIVLSSSIAFQNTLDNGNPMTTSKGTIIFLYYRHHKNVRAAEIFCQGKGSYQILVSFVSSSIVFWLLFRDWKEKYFL